MNRLFGLFAAPAAMLLVACSALFEEPVQCALDGDCARFEDAVCGANGTCESRSGGAVGTPGGPASGSSASASAATDSDAGPSAAPPPAAVTCSPTAARPDAPFPGDPRVGGAAGTDITNNVTIDCASNYVLQGSVFVQPGATLTLAPGAVVKGEAGAALYITAGAKIVARGTTSEPIVFTSAATTKVAGSWGGLYVLGLAPPTGTLAGAGLSYGGADEADSSGTLSFVRIEYAGRGLELDSVGRGTIIDGVQVRKTTDNCFTVQGGRVDIKHAVCQAPADEMFEITSGYSGRAQFLVGQLTPTNGAGHNGILLDGSQLTAANITMCGSTAANQGVGVVLRRNAAPKISAAVVRGFNAGLDVVGARGTPFALTNSLFSANKTENVAHAEGGSTDIASPLFDDDQGFDERAFVSDPAQKNAETDPGLEGCLNAMTPVFAPTNLTPADAPPADGFFDVGATYVGAVKDAASDWTKAAWLVWSND